MQGDYADPKTTGTADLELHQLGNTEGASETQRSASQTSQPAVRKTCSPKNPSDILQCQHCDFTTARSNDLKSHSRKHTGDMLECQRCDFTTAYSRSLKKHYSCKHSGDEDASRKTYRKNEQE